MQKDLFKRLLLSSLLFICGTLVCGCGQQKDKEPIKNTEHTFETQPPIDAPTEEATNALTESAQPTAEPEKPKETEHPPITISFTGDVYLGDALINAYRQQGCTGIADDTVLSALSNADITMINHEYACTNETQKVDYQLYNFRSDPEHEYILKELGVDIAGLSNNHIMDYGIAGMQETITSLQSLGIETAGAGSNIDEAKKAVIREVGRRRIAFVAASHFVPDVSWHAGKTTPGLLTAYEGTDNYKILLEYISDLKETGQADFVIIFAHYGVEKQNEFVPYQQQISHAWIDAGADLIVGSHAHVLQGMECYNGKYIFYNLGNFLFANYEKETMVLQVEIDRDNRLTAKILPCVTKAYYVRTMDAQEEETLYRFLESISVNVHIDADGWVRETREIS